jgi:hypothetical protein
LQKVDLLAQVIKKKKLDTIMEQLRTNSVSRGPESAQFFTATILELEKLLKAEKYKDIIINCGEPRNGTTTVQKFKLIKKCIL